jgi:CheY-like chemotaxis protein
LRDAFIASLDGDVKAIVADNAPAIRAALADADCLVVDDAVSDFGPEDVAEANERRDGICQLPVVLHVGAGLKDSRWRRQHRGFAIREGDSLETLVAHAALMLHRSPALMSDAERGAVEVVHGAHQALRGKKALIVDDDMRNIFALATVLDDEGMVIVSADNGREAIRLVESDPDIDIVLMDIMMPEMDGIATMQEIRKLPRGRELPMVAVTAKAMKGDRQKCIEAGAWDYLSKPVDPMHLLAVLRGWLCR